MLDMGELTDLFGGGPSSNKELVLIKSYSILGEAVDRLDLRIEITPSFFPLIGSRMFHRYNQYGEDGLAQPPFGLDSYAWGGEILDIDHFDLSGELSVNMSEWQVVTAENNEYLLLDKDEKEVLSGKVGEVATVNYQDSKLEILVERIIARPGQHFSVINTPRNEAIEELKNDLDVSEEGKDSGMISLSLDGKDQKKITAILNLIADFYVQSNKEKRVNDAGQVLDFIDEQLPELKKKLDAAERDLQNYRQKVGTVNIKFEIETALSAVVEYERMILETELKRAEQLRGQFKENHPYVKVYDKQIKKIEGKITEVEKKMYGLPEEELGFIQRTRDVEVATALYMALLERGQELGIVKASTLANVRVVDSAELIYKPIKPRKMLILAFSLILGLILGVAWVLLKVMLHKGVEDPDLIERETGIPVFANIPRSEVERGIHSSIEKRKRDVRAEAKLLAFENDSDLAMEAMRSFRTNMRFSMKAAESNVIIISGPSPSIGKSFFSSNYSAIAAQDGQRVLLIDADMRKGNMHKKMGVPQTPGLSELIAGDISIDEATHEIKGGFHFIACGERPPNSAELVSSDNFQALLEQFKQQADLVIIDTPPILAVADASIIAQYGGQLFLLLRSGQHAMGEIQAATSRFQKSGVKVSGILMNDVELKANSYSYHYEYK
jgi:tyrosine-protein kinase Etk/Wzc